jgi:hypothetical protein
MDKRSSLSVFKVHGESRDAVPQDSSTTIQYSTYSGVAAKPSDREAWSQDPVLAGFSMNKCSHHSKVVHQPTDGATFSTACQDLKMLRRRKRKKNCEHGRGADSSETSSCC